MHHQIVPFFCGEAFLYIYRKISLTHPQKSRVMCRAQSSDGNALKIFISEIYKKKITNSLVAKTITISSQDTIEDRSTKERKSKIQRKKNPNEDFEVEILLHKVLAARKFLDSFVAFGPLVNRASKSICRSIRFSEISSFEVWEVSFEKNCGHKYYSISMTLRILRFFGTVNSFPVSISR